MNSRLGWDAVRVDASRSIIGRVEPRREGYVANLELEEPGARGARRTLESQGADCTPLDDAVVLALALAIDPNAALAAPTQASEARFPDFEQKRTATERWPAATLAIGGSSSRIPRSRDTKPPPLTTMLERVSATAPRFCLAR